MDIIRNAADPKCSAHLVNSINKVDSILSSGRAAFKRQLKSLFGLSGLEHDDDFVSVLEVMLMPLRRIIRLISYERAHSVRGKQKIGIPLLVAPDLTSFVPH